VKDYLKMQGRFKHLLKPGNEALLERIQDDIDRRWNELKYRCNAV
jgi:pyruvate ferredoxin oxidoreductase beta subunit